MTRKTKLAIIGCLLLVGIMVALFTSPRAETVSLLFIGYTNGGTRALFQVKGPTNAVYLMPVVQVKGSHAWRIETPADYASGKILATVPDGTQSWRCRVDVFQRTWVGRNANWLRKLIPEDLFFRFDEHLEVYSPEIVRWLCSRGALSIELFDAIYKPLLVGNIFGAKRYYNRWVPFGRSVWGELHDAKAWLADYSQVLLVSVKEDWWEDRGLNTYSLHHFKGTVVRTFSGDWRVSEKVTFAHGVDDRARMETNANAGKLLFLFSNQRTNVEFGGWATEFLIYNPETERQLDLLFAKRK